MTVDVFAKESGFKIITLPSPKKEIDGAYIGDLLSWVMGNGNPNNLWITIMSNINTIAVSTLVDFSCILLAENVQPDKDVLATAEQKGVNILSTNLSAYEAALKVAALIH